MNKNSKILITGGTGFAGSHLIESLINKGFNDVHATAISGKNEFVSNLIGLDNVHVVNLTDDSATFNLFEQLKPDYIFHLAATPAVGSSFSAVKQVIQETIELQFNVLEAAVKFCPRSKLLMIGSALEYKSQDKKLTELDPLGPENPYAVSKVAQEMLAFSYYRSHDLPVIFTRSFNHIGERQSPGFAISDFAQQIAKIEKNLQTEIHVGNLSASRDFTDVKDIAEAYILLMDKGEIGQTYNVGSGVGFTIAEMLDKITACANIPIKVVVDKDKFRPIDVASVIADNTKIKNLGWSPKIPISDTLERTLTWWRQQI